MYTPTNGLPEAKLSVKSLEMADTASSYGFAMLRAITLTPVTGVVLFGATMLPVIDPVVSAKDGSGYSVEKIAMSSG